MAIRDDTDFEEHLAQLNRLYRALRETWGQTHASDEREVVDWIKTGGALLEKLDEVLSDIEDHAGCVDLRIILDQMQAIRQEREGVKERA